VTYFTDGNISISPTSICVGGPVTLTANAFNCKSLPTATSCYAWHQVDGNNVDILLGTSSNDTFNFTAPANAGTYKYYVKGYHNGVQSASEMDPLTVLAAIATNTVSASQTICSEGTPAVLTNNGILSGGSGSYIYQWQRSNDDFMSDINNIGGQTNAGYSPGSLTATTYYRRKVTSGGCESDSNTITITINTANAGSIGYIDSNQTICVGGNPGLLTSTILGTGTSVLYKWEFSTNSTNGSNGDWTEIGGATNPTYDPPGGLLTTTYYRRITSSTLNTVICTATSNAVKITVQSGATTANANIDQAICDNPTVTLNGSGTGNGTLSYLWTSGGTGSFNSTQTNANAVYTQSTQDISVGTVILTLKVSGGGCDATDDMVVTFDKTPPALTGVIPSGATLQDLCYSAIPAGPTAAAIAALYTDGCGGMITVVKTGTPTGNDCSWTVTYHYTVADKFGNFATAVDITYSGADKTAPVLTVPANTTAECSALPAAGVAGDASANDNCDATPTVTYVGEESTQTADGTCTDQNYTLTRTWKAEDNCGNSSTKSQTITIRDNIKPTFNAPANLTIYTDADCNYDVDVAFTGDVTDEADNCSAIINATFVDAAPVAIVGCEGGYTIERTWSLSDNCGNSAEDQKQTITIRDNIAPTFNAPADLTIYTDVNCAYDEGIAFTGDVEDEADNCSTNIEATFSDAAPVAIVGCEGGYTIERTWSLSDNCGNAADDQVQTITIRDNIKPDLGDIVPLDPIAVNTTFIIKAPSNGDACSAVTATWYLDPNGIITDPLTAPFYASGVLENSYIKGTINSSMFETTANPTGTGVYSVMLVVSDACGNKSVKTYDFVVIYDPNGGFVTGGGWIDSPAGAYAADINLTGKANFGFNAKYKTGKNNINEVDGNTNFQFKEGDFHFKSSSHDAMSLVISGERKATYKGVGTVNGSGNYGFMVTVIDGEASGAGQGDIDSFRIKIWDGSPSNVVYDNEKTFAENADASTPLGGGSIVIHKPKGNVKEQEGILVKTTPIIMQEMDPEILETLVASPNPVVSFSTVRFSVREDANVILRVYDYSGRMVETLYNGQAKAYQNYDVDFQRRNLMSGIYIVKLTTDKGQSYDKRIIVE